MQSNDEQIFDGFIRGRLENATPDMMLLDNSFNAFLLERKERIKRRWFFWLFLFLSVFMIPFGYYIISIKNNLRNTNIDVGKENTSIIINDTNTSLNTETRGQNKSTNTSFTGEKELRKSVQIDVVEENKKDVDKLQQRKINDKPNTAEQNSVFSKTIAADSAALSGKASQKNIVRTVDSVMKKKDKTVAKTDTFYIVW